MNKEILFTPTMGKIKIDAVTSAVGLLGLPYTVQGLENIPSGVAEQPVDFRQGFEGGFNRVLLSGENAVAIENFITITSLAGPNVKLAKQHGTPWNGTIIHDIAAIVRRIGNSFSIASSAGIEFPQEDYLEAFKIGLATQTVGGILAKRLAKHGVDGKNPHAHYTGEKYGRPDFLIPPIYLSLMEDKKHGERLEKHIQDKISHSGLIIPNNIRFLSTSKQPIKNNSLVHVLSMLNASTRRVQMFDGNAGLEHRHPAQLVGLDACFQSANDRIQSIREHGAPERQIGVVTISMQSGLFPLIVGIMPYWLDVTAVLGEYVVSDNELSITSSVSVGVPIPNEYVDLAFNQGGFKNITAGEMVAKIQGGDRTDPQKNLYGISKEIFLEEALFVLFAQMFRPSNRPV